MSKFQKIQISRWKSICCCNVSKNLNISSKFDDIDDSFRRIINEFRVFRNDSKVESWQSKWLISKNYDDNQLSDILVDFTNVSMIRIQKSTKIENNINNSWKQTIRQLEKCEKLFKKSNESDNKLDETSKVFCKCQKNDFKNEMRCNWNKKIKKLKKKVKKTRKNKNSIRFERRQISFDKRVIEKIHRMTNRWRNLTQRCKTSKKNWKIDDLIIWSIYNEKKLRYDDLLTIMQID